jgi:hypothetical protein
MKWITVIPLITLTGISYAKDTPYCVIEDYGIVDATPIHQRSFASESTAMGVMNKIRGQISFSRTTTKIPAKIGTRFGVKHSFFNIPKGERLMTVISHPKMLSPSGDLKTASGGPKRATSNGTSYAFDKKEELQPGIWVFSFYHKDRLLCSQDFNVYIEQKLPIKQ